MKNMAAIIEYIERFLLDNQPPQTRLNNVKVLRCLLENIEEDIKGQMRRETMKQILNKGTAQELKDFIDYNTKPIY